MTSEILICFSAGNTWFCHVLRRLFNTAFDQCFIMYQSHLWGGWWIAQPCADGIKKIPAENFIKRQMVIECWGYQQNIELGFQTMRVYRGVKSNWLKLFRNLLYLQFHDFFDRKVRESNVFFSRLLGFEFCADILKCAGVSGTEQWDTSCIPPKDLHQFLSNHPHFFVTRNPVI